MSRAIVPTTPIDVPLPALNLPFVTVTIAGCTGLGRRRPSTAGRRHFRVRGRTAVPTTRPLARVAQMSQTKGSFWRIHLCLLKLDLSRALGVLRCSGC